MPSTGAFARSWSLKPSARDARYCLRRAGSIGQGRCDFSTRQACMRIAAASRATCHAASTRFHLDLARMR
ncbi:DUF3551 domain-containing protein [Bradyrhizobium sp. F1.4.3]|uniref:DUF3551 domain-containing protein n=1 Tax=Bradyrhizobium sp. F1.4.3 TaxID=3156356 RepID=UPI00339A3B6D